SFSTLFIPNSSIKVSGVFFFLQVANLILQFAVLKIFYKNTISIYKNEVYAKNNIPYKYTKAKANESFELPHLQGSIVS
ncbi:hypothetical protein, partial [Lactovum miscens]